MGIVRPPERGVGSLTGFVFRVRGAARRTGGLVIHNYPQRRPSDLLDRYRAHALVQGRRLDASATREDTRSSLHGDLLSRRERGRAAAPIPQFDRFGSFHTTWDLRATCQPDKGRGNPVSRVFDVQTTKISPNYTLSAVGWDVSSRFPPEGRAPSRHAICRGQKNRRRSDKG